jgi:hypothetical protein
MLDKYKVLPEEELSRPERFLWTRPRFGNQKVAKAVLQHPTVLISLWPARSEKHPAYQNYCRVLTYLSIWQQQH